MYNLLNIPAIPSSCEIKNTWELWVENSVPIIAIMCFTLRLKSQCNFELCKMNSMHCKSIIKTKLSVQLIVWLESVMFNFGTVLLDILSEKHLSWSCYLLLFWISIFPFFFVFLLFFCCFHAHLLLFELFWGYAIAQIVQIWPFSKLLCAFFVWFFFEMNIICKKYVGITKFLFFYFLFFYEFTSFRNCKEERGLLCLV